MLRWRGKRTRVHVSCCAVGEVEGSWGFGGHNGKKEQVICLEITRWTVQAGAVSCRQQLKSPQIAPLFAPLKWHLFEHVCNVYILGCVRAGESKLNEHGKDGFDLHMTFPCVFWLHISGSLCVYVRFLAKTNGFISFHLLFIKKHALSSVLDCYMIIFGRL